MMKIHSDKKVSSFKKTLKNNARMKKKFLKLILDKKKSDKNDFQVFSQSCSYFVKKNKKSNSKEKKPQLTNTNSLNLNIISHSKKSDS